MATETELLHRPRACTPTSRLSDAQLVARCRSGDEAAWHELVNRFAGCVYATVHRSPGLRTKDEVEEIFQEVFARTYEHLGELRDPGAVGFWIKQITRRLCIDRLRTRWHVTLPDDEMELRLDSNDALQEVDEGMAIQQTLASLSEPCREILDRFFRREETYEGISQALGLPYGTIASRISRCTKKLRSNLEAEDLLQ
jgi:RNA polymerase sigma-70 factor (ECF subfamily)